MLHYNQNRNWKSPLDPFFKIKSNFSEILNWTNTSFWCNKMHSRIELKDFLCRISKTIFLRMQPYYRENVIVFLKFEIFLDMVIGVGTAVQICIICLPVNWSTSLPPLWLCTMWRSSNKDIIWGITTMWNGEFAFQRRLL